jgi:hypothetical protein
MPTPIEEIRRDLATQLPYRIFLIVPIPLPLIAALSEGWLYQRAAAMVDICHNRILILHVPPDEKSPRSSIAAPR